MLDTLLSLLLALSITLVIETVLAFVLGVRSKHDFLCVLLINVITNVTLNVILLPIEYALKDNKIAVTLIVIALEVVVVICEYLFYKKKLEYKDVHPLLLSIILNGASFSLGIMVSYLIYG